MKTVHKQYFIPIFGVKLFLIISKDINKDRKKFENYFGPVQSENYDALCSHSGGETFALFFTASTIDMRIISHEIFHLTHRILDWVGGNFDKTHHEQGALLCGYLTGLVTSECKQKGFKL